MTAAHRIGQKRVANSLRFEKSYYLPCTHAIRATPHNQAARPLQYYPYLQHVGVTGDMPSNSKPSLKDWGDDEEQVLAGCIVDVCLAQRAVFYGNPQLAQWNYNGGDPINKKLLQMLRRTLVGPHKVSHPLFAPRASPRSESEVSHRTEASAQPKGTRPISGRGQAKDQAVSLDDALPVTPQKAGMWKTSPSPKKMSTPSKRRRRDSSTEDEESDRALFAAPVTGPRHLPGSASPTTKLRPTSRSPRDKQEMLQEQSPSVRGARSEKALGAKPEWTIVSPLLQQIHDLEVMDGESGDAKKVASDQLCDEGLERLSPGAPAKRACFRPSSQTTRSPAQLRPDQWPARCISTKVKARPSIPLDFLISTPSLRPPSAGHTQPSQEAVSQ
ncbi:unnamed protein product [Parajaminaea phylloscopi]